MITPEEKKIHMLIEQAMRPLENRLNRAERELRRLKSDLTQTKNTVARLRK